MTAQTFYIKFVENEKIRVKIVADSANTTFLRIRTVDSTVNVPNVSEIILPNGKLVDNGNGTATIILDDAITTYVHTQSISTTTWLVNHNLGQQHVLVQCFDDTDKMILPHEIQLNSSSQCTLTFTTTQSGHAVIKK